MRKSPDRSLRTGPDPVIGGMSDTDGFLWPDG